MPITMNGAPNPKSRQELDARARGFNKGAFVGMIAGPVGAYVGGKIGAAYCAKNEQKEGRTLRWAGTIGLPTPREPGPSARPRVWVVRCSAPELNVIGKPAYFLASSGY